LKIGKNRLITENWHLTTRTTIDMKLINEIIELLSSGDINLSTALLKTKVLLHKLGEKNL